MGFDPISTFEMSILSENGKTITLNDFSPDSSILVTNFVTRLQHKLKGILWGVLNGCLRQ